MRISELQKQLTDYLVNYGDDHILVTAKPELESRIQPFEVGPSNPMEGFPRVAIMDVPPSVLGQYKPAEPGICANTCSDEVEKADEPAKSLSESSESSQTNIDEITSILNRFTASLKEGDGPDPEKTASEEPVSALERILKEITSSGPVNIEIRVSL